MLSSFVLLLTCMRFAQRAAATLENSRGFAELFEGLAVALHIIPPQVLTGGAPASSSSSSSSGSGSGGSSSSSGSAIPALAENGVTEGSVGAQTVQDTHAAVVAKVAAGTAKCLRERVPMNWQSVTKVLATTFLFFFLFSIE